MVNLGLRFNFQNKALTQYIGYDFNSMAMFGRKPIAIDESGIYEIFSGDSDNGKDIDASFELPETNLQMSYNKRIRSIFLGCRADGDLFVTVRDDEESIRTYQVTPTKLEKQHTSELNCGRNWHKGCYYSIRIGNANGAYFDFDYIQILPVILPRQPGKF